MNSESELTASEKTPIRSENFGKELVADTTFSKCGRQKEISKKGGIGFTGHRESWRNVTSSTRSYDSVRDWIGLPRKKTYRL